MNERPEPIQAAAILESLAEGVVAVNAAGDIVSINPAGRALLGLGSPSRIDGANLFETLRQSELHALVREVLHSGRPALREFPLFSPRERRLRAQGVPCAAPGVGGARVVVLLQDVTELRRYDRLRREFVANVSHELKSPLTSIRSLTETLLDGGLADPDCNQRFLSLIDEDANRLSRLIDDLLILSQVESRAVPLRLAALELADCVESVLAPRQVLISEKGLQLLSHIPAGTTVYADPDRLRQVLDNLYDNAIKYSPISGIIELWVRPAPHGKVEVRIHDQGPGIPEKARLRIFERFYRVDKNRARELGGTGLGLSIVKHIVESHGGQAWVEGEPGQGSQFCFTLPLAGAEPGAESVPALAEPHLEENESHGELDLQTELGQLQERLLVMGGLVEKAVGRAVQALTWRDAEMARRVLQRDRLIDQAEMALDEVCLRLLAEHRPSGSDLRMIAIAFKVNADLERMGDLAVNIAHRTLDLLRQPLLHPLLDIQALAEQSQFMLKRSLDALVERDVEMAVEVCRRDDEADRLNRDIFEKMLHLIQAQPETTERAVGLMLVGRALERIADHATNIAENVIYLVTGRSAKHRSVPQSGPGPTPGR